MKEIAALLLLLPLASCANATLRTEDPRRAVALAPFLRPVPPFGRIHIPEGTILYPATVDSQAAWCTTTAVYFVPGEVRQMCFFDRAGDAEAEGWFSTAYIVGSLSSLRYDVDVPYRVMQQAPLPPRR